MTSTPGGAQIDSEAEDLDQSPPDCCRPSPYPTRATIGTPRALSYRSDEPGIRYDGLALEPPTATIPPLRPISTPALQPAPQAGPALPPLIALASMLLLGLGGATFVLWLLLRGASEAEP